MKIFLFLTRNCNMLHCSYSLWQAYELDVSTVTLKSTCYWRASSIGPWLICLDGQLPHRRRNFLIENVNPEWHSSRVPRFSRVKCYGHAKAFRQCNQYGVTHQGPSLFVRLDCHAFHSHTSASKFCAMCNYLMMVEADNCSKFIDWPHPIQWGWPSGICHNR